MYEFLISTVRARANALKNNNKFNISVNLCGNLRVSPCYNYCTKFHGEAQR